MQDSCTLQNFKLQINIIFPHEKGHLFIYLFIILFVKTKKNDGMAAVLRCLVACKWKRDTNKPKILLMHAALNISEFPREGDDA